MITDDLYEKAEGFKSEANSYFKVGEYDNAIASYTKAIDHKESAIYYANRSFAYLKTECFGYALNDASKAIELDNTYTKGYYRRASANMALGKFKEAQEDFEAVVRVAPGDKDARAKLAECQKISRIKAFAKAIAVEEKASPLDTFNPSSVVIEPSYDGPHLECIDSENKNNPTSYVVTESFMLTLLENYKKQKQLHKKYALIILRQIRDILRSLPSLVEIDVPDDAKFTVCGDIHGQFYDLMNIFDINGLPSEDNPYLFNGDFVDRGSFSVECIFTLMGFKLLYPKHFYMSRGNHESENMNQMYGFEGEVKSKYGVQMVDIFTEVFNWLPLSHLINSHVLVMHGGLFSEKDVKIDALRNVSRNRQPPDSGLMCELLWSDPMELPGLAPSKRGVGCQFGSDITAAFCKDNDIDFIIRSHEVKNLGYESTHDGRCITVFSAPNYCDIMRNLGAFITLCGSHKPGGMVPKFTSFKEVPHPNVRPMAYANSLLSSLA